MTVLSHLTLLAALTLGSAAFAGDFSGTLTGPRGGTTSYEGSCITTEGRLSCTRQDVITGPAGNVTTRDVMRETTSEGTLRKIETTGPLGRTVTTTRERKF
ncbi:hypothetical protein [Tabrizicola sp.]|uniref:hypothetical protein n=1 Tax=Tabrizicola sp. TaxID=2005166 RepID=UPI002869FB87|nr:hypothetical protein [Tabrizicola sp.]